MQGGKWHFCAELREAGEAKAERLIQEALRSEGLTAEYPATWRKGHPFKLKLAVKLHEQTTVTALG
jgi:hypothetical protein